MKIGDLVQWTQRYKGGNVVYMYGMVVASKLTLDKTKLFRVKWFDQTKDTWHRDPTKLPSYRDKEIKVISES